MSHNLQQVFPQRIAGQVQLKKWTVDISAAFAVNRLGQRNQERLRREVAEMADHFPRWLLTLATNDQARSCAHCGGLLVFWRGVRCVSCEVAVNPKRFKGRSQLAWFGLMPPIGIDSLQCLKPKLLSHSPKQHLVGQQPGIGHYLLVPLLATYPADFPKKQVTVSYLPGFFQIPGIPKKGMSHAYHMLDRGKMCLFAAREWSRLTSCREVLQQRAYAHVVKFLNYGNGKKNAFAIVS